MATLSAIELTRFTKDGGLLCKILTLAPDGTLISDSSACRMWKGTAERVTVANVAALAALIEGLNSSQALALGVLRRDLPAKVEIATDKVARSNPKLVARTQDNLVYDGPAPALLDFDSKGMPPTVTAELKRLGGFWPALTSVLPALATTARVLRASTSAGLTRSDTRQAVRGSDGVHAFPVIQDGADAPRFLRALHARCWLKGLGWLMVGGGGQLLERSIVDRMVGTPEHLVFEAPPELKPPLRQGRRHPTATAGAVLDTATACPPLTIVERARYQELKARETERLAPAAAKARAAFIAMQTKRLVKRTGKSPAIARRIVERWCEGVLLPDVVLEFDEEEFDGCTVGDVLADPERFEGATLADPLEGVPYGRCKAKIMRREDGTPWIHSFAHGRTVYKLKLDAASLRKVLESTAKEDVVATLAKCVVKADLDAVEIETLKRQAHELSGAGLRAIAAVVKQALQQQAAQDAKTARAQQAAQRQDPRPHIRAPSEYAPWLDVVGVLNEVIGPAAVALRDIDGDTTRIHKVPVLNMHAFTSTGANAEPQESTE